MILFLATILSFLGQERYLLFKKVIFALQRKDTSSSKKRYLLALERDNTCSSKKRYVLQRHNHQFNQSGITKIWTKTYLNKTKEICRIRPPYSANKENIGSQTTKCFPSLFQAYLVFETFSFLKFRYFSPVLFFDIENAGCSDGGCWKSTFMHLCRISHVLQTEWHKVNISHVFSH